MILNKNKLDNFKIQVNGSNYMLVINHKMFDLGDQLFLRNEYDKNKLEVKYEYDHNIDKIIVTNKYDVEMYIEKYSDAEIKDFLDMLSKIPEKELKSIDFKFEEANI